MNDAVRPPHPPASAAYEGHTSVEAMRARQRFWLALLVGPLAAAAGVALWGSITLHGWYDYDLMTVVIGWITGYAVRLAGRGGTLKFGLWGALNTLLGLAMGKMVHLTLLAHVGAPPQEVLQALRQADPRALAMQIVENWTDWDYLLLAIALYEGYAFSFLYKIRTGG